MCEYIQRCKTLHSTYVLCSQDSPMKFESFRFNPPAGRFIQLWILARVHFFFEKWCICGFFGQQFWCYQICCHLVETMSGRRSSCCLGSRTWLVLAALCCAMQSDGMRLDSLTVATFLFVGFCVLRWLTVRYCLSCPISIIPSYPHYFIYDFPIFHSSMDWFKGKSTGNHRFSHQTWGFPVNFPLNRSIE